jgi:PKHD-type hydroxylase
LSGESVATVYRYLLPAAVEERPGDGVGLKWAPGTDPFDSRPRPLVLNSALPAAQTLLDAFTPEECEAIIALGERRPLGEGRADAVGVDYRVSKIAWIEPDEDARWLYHRLGLLVHRANRYYGFELVGFAEPLQYTLYGPGHRFEWHMDLGAGPASARKLSLTVQLSEASEYEGGDLEFFNARGEGAVRRPRGSVTFFPSYLAHRVSPVTRGLRRSLVAWACGPGFR